MKNVISLECSILGKLSVFKNKFSFTNDGYSPSSGIVSHRQINFYRLLLHKLFQGILVDRKILGDSFVYVHMALEKSIIIDVKNTRFSWSYVAFSSSNFERGNFSQVNAFTCQSIKLLKCLI